MPVLVRVFRVVINTMHALLAGVRWLARQTYRQRSLGVSVTPHLTRLLDLHAVTVAAHIALVAALIVARPGPALWDWLLALPAALVLTGLGIWRSGRFVLGGFILLQVAGLVVAALWARQPVVLALLVTAAVAQQASLVAAWLRHTGSPGQANGEVATPRPSGERIALLRATAAGLLLGVFTGGAGFLVGLFTSVFPLWISAALLCGAVVLAVRMPRPERRPAVPPQKAAATVPDGYTVYRPSSLDDRSR